MIKPTDRLEKYIHKNGSIRASAVIATQAVEEMRKTLGAYDLATVLVGRSMVGALLMAAHLKKGDNVAVYLRGNGPLSVVYAEGDHEGATRGYTPNPEVQLPLVNGKLDIKSGIGIGILDVVRGSSHTDQMHKGTVELVSGQVGEDLAYYLYQSQQIPSVVALSVELNKDGSVKAAGGILIELMPGADENVIQDIEKRTKTAKNLGEMIVSGAQPMELLAQFMNSSDLAKIHTETNIKYYCRCSKDRVMNALMLLGHDELQDMINSQEQKHIIKCDFCGKKYEIDAAEIEGLRQKAFKQSLN